MIDPLDLTGAVQTAVFAALSPVDGMPPVVSEVPIGEDDQPTYPIVLLGDDQVTEVGGKGSRLEQHDLAIHVVLQGATKKTARTLQELVRAALHDQPLPDQAGVLIDPLKFQNGNLVLLEDGTTYVGTQNFKTFAQPAG